MTIRDELRGGVWEHPLSRVEATLPGPRPPWWVRRRRLLLGCAGALGLLVLVAAAGTWLALGVRDSMRTGTAQAAAADREFQAVQDTQGDATAAVGHLDAAALRLGSARKAADTPQMRLVGLVPWAKIPVSDLHHLLNAGDDLLLARRLALEVDGAFVYSPGSSPAPAASATPSPTGSGGLSWRPGLLPGTGPLPGVGHPVGSARTTAPQPSSTNGPLYVDDTVSLPVLADLTAKAEQAAQLVRDGERELLAVDGGGIGEQQVPALRDRALEQVREARQRFEPLVPVLRLLPPLLGAEGTRTYLVAVLDQASMRPPGGAPLAVATLTLDQGRVALGSAQAVAGMAWPKVGSTGSARLRWTPVAGDPYTAAAGTAGLPFVDAAGNPDFRVAGESLARAWEAGTGQRIDGVVTLDVSALRELLRVTGPVPVPAATSPQADAGDVAQLLLADLRAAPDSAQRQLVGTALLGAVASRLTSGGSPGAKLQALLAAAPGRHVQIWTADPAAERFAIDNGLAGAVAAPAGGDHLDVYARATDDAGVDALQQRTVDEVVRLAADGSAEVTRTVTQRNTASATAGGPSPATARTELVTLLPAGAQVTKAPREDRHLGAGAGIASAPDDRTTDAQGRLVVRQTVQVPPGGVVTWSVSFRVPHLATPEGTGLSLPLLLEPSPTLDPTQTRTVVLPPAGWRVGSGPGVQVVSGQGVVNGALDRQRTVTVSLAQG